MRKQKHDYVILVVDDDEGMSCLIQKYLKRDGYQTAFVGSGQALLSWLETQSADLMLLDYKLPDMTGEALINRLREKKLLLPFVMITGHGGERVTVEMMKLGAQDYLIKDGDLLETLPTVVTQVIEKLEQSARLVEAEEELRKSEERFRLLAENATDLISRQTRDGLLLYVSPASKLLLGYDPEDMMGRYLTEFCHPNDATKLKTVIAKVGSEVGTADTLEYRVRKNGDRYAWFETTFKPIFDSATGEIEEIQGASRDISKRRSLESDLRQAQKMEAVGVLAAGIAHEINTPMQFIKDNTRFTLESVTQILPMLEKFRPGNQAGDSDADTARQVLFTESEEREIEYMNGQLPMAIRETLEGLDHVISIVSAMKEFSYSGISRKTKSMVNINKCLNSAALLARNEIKYVADLVWHMHPQLPDILSYPDDLNQVFLNLLVNASHAIADKIKSKTAGNGSKGLITVTTDVENESVRISIADNGKGMKETETPRIFEPFYTTKDVGKGTGIGLSIVHEIIVNKHNGRIDVVTELNVGTTFHIVLPINEE